MTAMLNQLEEFYRDNGILSTHFTCKHKDACKGDCKNFTGPKSAYVGEGYEAGELPRLLFVSLDSGDGAEEPEHRLPVAVRDSEHGTVVDDLHKNQHWYHTYELAWYILKRFDSKFEKVEDVKGFFAHTNSAKCCLNNPGREQADDRLFENCRGYLEGELKVLAPQLLVTQGAKADAAVDPLIERVKTVEENCAYHGVLFGQPIFWLLTYHPRYAPGFHAQRKGGEGWEFYAEEMYRFINRQQGG